MRLDGFYGRVLRMPALPVQDPRVAHANPREPRSSVARLPLSDPAVTRDSPLHHR
jgi:hypothetical protein